MGRLIVFVLVISAGFGQNFGDPFTFVRLIRRPAGTTANSDVVRWHRQAKAPVDVIGLKSITGTEQVWLVEAHGSFASLEATDKALAATPVEDRDASLAPATLVGLLRPGLSYRPDDAIKGLPAARYFQVTIFRTRPGAQMDFAEVIRIRNAAADSVNVDRPELGYQIISGAESGTYVFLAPMPSLASIDEAMARTWRRGGGGEAGHAARQATNKITTEADISREQLLFRVEPRASYVSESFAAGSPEFWSGK